MGVKVFVSSSTGDMKTLQNQQRILTILKSLDVNFVQVDLTSPGQEGQREFMRKKAKVRPGQSVAVPPQIFNSGRYCGDYQDFDEANEACRLGQFLGVELKGSVRQVVGSWKGKEEERPFVELACWEKTPEFEAADSDKELEEVELENKENSAEEDKFEHLPDLIPTVKTEAGSSLSPEREDIFTGEPIEVKMHLLEVFPNLPVSPVQKVEAATYHRAISSVELTPETSPPPPHGVDVAEFQLTWKEMRKQRQIETVQKYKEKLQNEADFLHRSEDRGPVFNRVSLLLSLDTLFK